MKLNEQIFLKLKSNKIKYKTFNQLFLFLAKELDDKPENIAKCINKMLMDGVLIENSHRQLELAENYGLKKGTVCGNAKGFAFIKPINLGVKGFEVKKGTENDCFVPASQLFGALDGDTVLYRMEGHDSGTVVKILKRGNSELVGKLTTGEKVGFRGHTLDTENFYVIADNTKFSKPILISKKEVNGAIDGDTVVVDLSFQPDGNKAGLPIGRVKKVLKGEDIEKCISSILCENQVPETFPDKVIVEANGLFTDFEEEKKHRVDLTNKLLFTIDGADAKDLDDAVSIEVFDEGYLLGVHIADVGEYVKYNSELDKEAFIRGTSVYLPGRVYPMLPKQISNNLCSLNANEEKLALSVEMKIDLYGVVKSYRIFESVIKSVARLTYDQVFDALGKEEKDTKDLENKILSKEEVSEFLNKQNEEFPPITDKKVIEALKLMNELSLKLQAIRKKEGYLDLDLPETQFDMEGNKVLDVRRRERNDSHKLIENFMILANQVVAETFCNLDIPFVYRVHGEPSKTRVAEVIDIINSFGANAKMPKKITPIYIQSVLEEIQGMEFADIASQLLLRALEKAIYSEECLGHFGLALDYYCHFTSPIRRYPDLTIHRIIKKACRSLPNRIISDNVNKTAIQKVFNKDYDLEEFVIDSAWHSSERERMADEAERAADDLFKAEYMQDKIGEVYEGKIDGVANFGLFVELPNTVEGLIKTETLPADDYKYDEKKFILRGRKRKFILGQNVKVKVIAANMVARRIEFLLIEN